MRKRVELKAVYDQDLERMLANLGILDKLVAGELKCAVCECQVGLDNLGAIFPDGDEVGVACDNDRCIRIIVTRGAVAPSD
jgi:hypothetical protein